LEAVDIDLVVARRTTFGGTGHVPVAEQIELAAEAIQADEAWLETVGAA